MIWHPLILAVLVTDLLSLVLIIPAAGTALAIVAQWAPHSSDRQQLRLERRAETATIRAAWGMGFFAFATVLLVYGISNVLPALVPGAMCGTGVIQSTGGICERALIFRFLTVAILYFWFVLEKLNRSYPQAPLTQQSARVLLLSVPFIIVALSDTGRALIYMDAQQPVDCCAVIYDQVRGLTENQDRSGLWESLQLGGFWGVTALLTIYILWLKFSKSAATVKFAGLLVIILILWLPLAVFSLINSFSAYYYQVLHHHCPWCLFLSQHRYVGFFLFGALTIIALEGPVALIMAKIAEHYPGVKSLASQRIRRVCFRLVIAVSAYVIMVSLPALVWRIRHGLWMAG